MIWTFPQQSPRAVCRNLWLTAALLAGGAVVAIVWALALDRPQPPQSSSAQPPSHGAASRAGPDVLKPVTVADFGKSLDYPWRQPLSDAPAVVIETRAPPLKLKLVGTMLEPVDTGPPQAAAMVITGDGRLVTVRVGDKLENATVTAIEDGRVTVNYFDKPQVLTLDPS